MPNATGKSPRACVKPLALANVLDPSVADATRSYNTSRATRCRGAVLGFMQAAFAIQDYGEQVPLDVAYTSRARAIQDSIDLLGAREETSHGEALFATISATQVFSIKAASGPLCASTCSS